MSDTGTAAATTTAATTTTTTTDPWYTGMDENSVKHIRDKGWDKVDLKTAALHAINSHQAAEKMLGGPRERLIALPKDEKDGAAWNDIAVKLGVPQDGKYDFTGVKFADGTELDGAFVDEMSKVLKDAMVPKDRAAAVIKKIVELGDKSEAGEIAERNAKIAQERETLKINWGSNVERNLVVADNAAAKLGVTPEAMAAMKNGMGASAVAEMFLKIGVAMGEDKFVSGAGVNGTNQAMSGEMAQARIKEMMGDPAWSAKLSAGDATAMQEFNNVTRIVAEFERSKRK